MPRRDIITVGASAGGVEALAELARGLPADLPAAVFVVLHLPADATSALPSILDRAGSLPAAHAVDGAPNHPGHIYVAPPNHHLTVDGARMRVWIGPRVNNVRPSIDVLFRSAARAFGERVIGVVLSGTLADGALGLDAIKLRGGTAVVQDPAEARFPGMPLSALGRIEPDYVLPVAEIPPLLARLCHEPVRAPTRPERSGAVPPNRSVPANGDAAPSPHAKRGNVASGLSCPTCHGSVWELDDGGLTRIECRVGHAFSVDAFLGEQAVALEDALWSAINALEERAATLRRFATRLSGPPHRRQMYAEQAEAVEQQAALLREGLVRVIQAETEAASGSPARPAADRAS